MEEALRGAGHEDSAVTLRCGAWYAEQPLTLRLPSRWQVSVLSPTTLPGLSEQEIGARVRAPIGQAPLRDLAAGCVRPVIVVDDPTRPTPAAAVIPHVLDEFEAAGIPSDSVTVVAATGTHGPPRPGALAKKIGALACARCRVVVHDHTAKAVRLGRTGFGTPVEIDPEVASADCLVGIGGVYPQHTTWLGGGSKLLLGVLSERSIAHLHYRHWHLRGRYATDNDFRQDLDEVSALARLTTSISVQVDADRKPVYVVAGEHHAAYAASAAFVTEAYRAPLPEGADVVISNAYPMDTSLTFALSKGTTPLRHAPAGASRIVVAACSEGDGRHGLFPLIDAPWYHYRWQWLRHQFVVRGELPGKVRRRLIGTVRRDRQDSGAGGAGAAPAATAGPMHLHLPAPIDAPLNPEAAGVALNRSWDELLELVTGEQGGRQDLHAAVYRCAPLQLLDLPELSARDAATADLSGAAAGGGGR